MSFLKFLSRAVQLRAQVPFAMALKFEGNCTAVAGNIGPRSTIGKRVAGVSNGRAPGASYMCNLDFRPAAFKSCSRRPQAVGGAGEFAMEFIIGLGLMAVIWIVVIYGSEYVNKNVQ